MAQHWSTEVFYHDFGRAYVYGSQQRTICAKMLRTHHDAVCAQIFNCVDQFVEHGESHGSAGDVDFLIVMHQLRNTVEGFVVGGGVANNQIATEGTSQAFDFLTNLDSQLVVSISHSGSQELIDVNVASQNAQLRNFLFEGCCTFGDGVVHINESSFAQGFFAVIQICLRIDLHERQDGEQVVTIDNGLDHALFKLVIRQLFSFFTQ